ncbi:hypothetical protein [Pseudovibrio sp. POLY-S9]|uniref:hypothetical protein n=1 Tax=Pseudovibrio sp. POLY-S9 TaxID=1576596 RepID=UPI001AD8FFBD|nr:hypothetical protein [Pseudovibrio sp. POLY-S9]
MTSSLNQRLAAAANQTLALTESASLSAAEIKLKKLAQTSEKYALPLALNLAEIPGHALSKLGLVAQLIMLLKSLGVNPFNLNSLKMELNSLKMEAPKLKSPKFKLDKLDILLPKIKPTLPLIGLVDLGLKQNLNMQSPPDIKALAQMLTNFGRWNVGFKLNLRTAFKVLSALNVIDLLQRAFDENLFSGNPKAWARITAKLSLFSRLLPKLNLKSPTAKMDLSGLDLNIAQADWLRNANRITMKASARASLRASARLNVGLFARTEAAIGLAYALSSALNIKPTSKCCSRCAFIF